ncbi:META domain-containing protein [Pseudoxanthobacter sp.]|uniref:META domain-containing protein n=1 Tax=Pseudoxanthobacter sp. TaxID=1925742 RepID=UPI002FE3B9F9
MSSRFGHRRPVQGVVLLLLACAMAAPARAGGGGLDGSWQVTALDGRPVAAADGLTLAFRGDQLSGFAGCNRFSAPYRFEPPAGDTQPVAIGPIRATRMACEPAKMERETAMMRAIGTAHTISRAQDGAVEMRSETGKVTLRFVQTAP